MVSLVLSHKTKILNLAFPLKQHNLRQVIDKCYSFANLFEKHAGIAQLVERCLAKAKVAGSNPVSRSIS